MRARGRMCCMGHRRHGIRSTVIEGNQRAHPTTGNRVPPSGPVRVKDRRSRCGPPTNTRSSCAATNTRGQSSTPTGQELNTLAAKASTPADHHSLEEYFLTPAQRYSADANQHAATATTCRGTVTVIEVSKLIGRSRGAQRRNG